MRPLQCLRNELIENLNHLCCCNEIAMSLVGESQADIAHRFVDPAEWEALLFAAALWRFDRASE